MADTPDEPMVDDIPIPKGNYEVQTEIELDLGVCTVPQMKAILGRFFFIFLFFQYQPEANFWLIYSAQKVKNTPISRIRSRKRSKFFEILN